MPGFCITHEKEKLPENSSRRASPWEEEREEEERE